MTAWRGALLPLALIVVGEVTFRVVQPDTDALAAPSAVVAAGWQAARDGTLLETTYQTLAAAFGGLVVGGIAGLAVGLALGAWRRLGQVAFLTIEALRPVPAIALIPLAMLVFGFGLRMEISIVALAVFWPMLLIAQAAVRGVPRELLEVARILELGPARTVAAVILPAIAPRLMTAIRLCAGLSLVVSVTVEIFGNPQGLGYGITIAQQGLDPALSLALLVWVGVLGFAVSWSLDRFQSTLAGRGLGS